jgi:hypothetical protein
VGCALAAHLTMQGAEVRLCTFSETRLDPAARGPARLLTTPQPARHAQLQDRGQISNRGVLGKPKHEFIDAVSHGEARRAGPCGMGGILQARAKAQACHAPAMGQSGRSYGRRRLRAPQVSMTKRRG